MGVVLPVRVLPLSFILPCRLSSFGLFPWSYAPDFIYIIFSSFGSGASVFIFLGVVLLARSCSVYS